MAKERKVINGGTNRKEERYVTLSVPIRLREDALLKKADELSKLDLKINEDKESARADATKRRESIKVLVEERDKLAKIVSTGEEEQMTKCLQKADFNRGRIVVTNAKTGDEIESLCRALEGEELDRMRRGRLPWADPDEDALPEKAKNDVESEPKKSKGNGAEAPAEA